MPNHRHIPDDPGKLPLRVRLSVVEKTARGDFEGRHALLKGHGLTVESVSTIIDSVREAYERGMLGEKSRKKAAPLLEVLDERMYSSVAPDEADVRFEELRED